MICSGRNLLCSFVLGFAAMGFLGIILCTAGGIGIYSDSVVYVGVARNLLRGEGVTYFDDNGHMAPVTHYAPLYPLVISALGLAGTDPLEGVRWVNALLFASNIMLAAWIVFASTHSVAASVAASFLAATAFPMVQIHSTALTEPLCLFLGFLGLYLMSQHINGSKQGMLYLSALSLALSSLTRYAGLIFILTGAGALMWLNSWTWKTKLLRASLFSVLSALPLLAWVIRNKLSAGNAVNRTFAVHLPGIKDLVSALEAVCLWLFPVTLLGETVWPRLLILLVLVGILSWSAIKMALLNSRLHQICLLFFVGYVAFVLASRSLLDAAIPFDTRMLAPAYFAAMIIVVSAVWVGRKRPLTNMSLLGRISIYVIFMLSALQAIPAMAWLKVSYRSGVGLAAKGWKDSASMRFVERLDATTPVYTNAPDLIYMFLDRLTYMIPRKLDPYSRLPNGQYESELAEMKRNLRDKHGVVVYFDAESREWFLPSLKDLETKIGLGVISAESDPVIYDIK
jgi:4-amino-4-deoxy-L-arabinose transferase-like glycosyltransferase